MYSEIIACKNLKSRIHKTTAGVQFTFKISCMVLFKFTNMAKHMSDIILGKYCMLPLEVTYMILLLNFVLTICYFAFYADVKKLQLSG